MSLLYINTDYTGITDNHAQPDTLKRAWTRLQRIDEKMK